MSEPHTQDNIEYWRNPGARNEHGSRSLVAAVLSPFRSKPTPAVETPFELLKRHVPIAQIMAQHGYGLDHFLRDGLDIEDFLANGYDWNDLCRFEYIKSAGPFRCLETLHRGLALNANHLRDNPDRLPVAAIKAATEMPTSDWANRFGLTFPENGPLHCFGDSDWNAMHCVALGLTMDDLMDFGLYRIEQYQDLMKGLTRSERAKAERDLRVTKQHIEELQAADAVEVAVPFVEEEQEAQPVEYEQVEVEVEEEVEEPIRHVTSDERRKHKIAAAAAAPAPVEQPLIVTRAQDRFRRHGFKTTTTTNRK
jgi:hypothetical protein